MDIFRMLQTLTETAAPSGNETAVAEVITQLWQPYVDSLSRDRLGNLVAVKQGQGADPRPRLMLTAHMDEIALMVKNIVQQGHNGFLRVTNIGGVDRRHLYGQTVVVHGERPLPGILGTLPDKMLPSSRRSRTHSYEELIVDIGLPFDTVKELVSVGDFVSFRQPLQKLRGRRVAGKALDNRASVAAVTVCLDYLNGRSHQWDLLAVATVQEEVGLRGAFTSAYNQRPDAAIAIDVTFGKGPGATDHNAFDLGGGPVLDLGPNVHPGMYQTLKEAAQALEMTIHTGTHTRSSGTDASALQIAREGIPTGIVSIPLRYMHTMVESLDMNDIKRAGRLLGEFTARLDDKFLKKLAEGLLK
ncbi:MAG: M20/M25/M40 family metallo-hydrolase [Chloroflexota bacterium]|jgi:tetrahedral aminopeptidase